MVKCTRHASKASCDADADCTYASGPKRAYCRVAKNSPRSPTAAAASDDLCRTLTRRDGRASRIFDDIVSVNRHATRDILPSSVLLDDGEAYMDVTTLYRRKRGDFFTLHPRAFAAGNYGKIFKGHFGVALAGAYSGGATRRCIVKKFMDDPRDAREVIVHATLFCATRHVDFAAFVARHPGAAAKIPAPLFAARYRTNTFFGMERVEVRLDDYMRAAPSHAQRWARFEKALVPLCRALMYLQDRFRFVHGDLYVGNVMVNVHPLRVFLIDFGRSSCDVQGKRISVDKSLRVPPTESLDLLVLLDSALSQFGGGAADAAVEVLCRRLLEGAYRAIFDPLHRDRKYQRFYDHYHAASVMYWVESEGPPPAHGVELRNDALARRLREGARTFTLDEFDAFRVKTLTVHHYVRGGPHHHFRPEEAAHVGTPVRWHSLVLAKPPFGHTVAEVTPRAMLRALGASAPQALVSSARVASPR